MYFYNLWIAENNLRDQDAAYLAAGISVKLLWSTFVIVNIWIRVRIYHSYISAVMRDKYLII